MTLQVQRDQKPQLMWYPCLNLKLMKLHFHQTLTPTPDSYAITGAMGSEASAHMVPPL